MFDPWPIVRDFTIALVIEVAACVVLFPLVSESVVPDEGAHRVERSSDGRAGRSALQSPRGATPDVDNAPDADPRALRGDGAAEPA